MFGSRVFVDVGVGDEKIALVGNQRVHGEGFFFGIVIADHFFHHGKVVVETPHRAAHQAVRVAEPHKKRAHQRAVGFQTAARHFFGYAFAFAQIVVFLPAGFVIRAVFDVDEFEILARLDG